MPTIDIADKTTLDSVNSKVDEILADSGTIGATNDSSGTTTSGSVFAKLNKIINDLATHVSNWTSTRAGYVDKIVDSTYGLDKIKSAIDTVDGICDNIYAKVDDEIATIDTVVDTINSAVGATGDTGGSTSAGTVMAKLNALLTSWTSTRAGYVDYLANSTYGLSAIRNLVVTNNTASKTGVLSAKLAYVISLLEDTTYGLSAIKTALSSSGGTTVSVQRGTITIAASSASGTATISSVSTSKSFVVYGGSRCGGSNTGNSFYWDATLVLTNSTTVTATRNGSYSYAAYVPYQVVTFS